MNTDFKPGILRINKLNHFNPAKAADFERLLPEPHRKAIVDFFAEPKQTLEITGMSEDALRDILEIQVDLAITGKIQCIWYPPHNLHSHVFVTRMKATVLPIVPIERLLGRAKAFARSMPTRIQEEFLLQLSEKNQEIDFGVLTEEETLWFEQNRANLSNVGIATTRWEF